MPKPSKIRGLPEYGPKMGFKNTPLGKLPTHAAVALLKLGEQTKRRERALTLVQAEDSSATVAPPSSPDEPRAIVTPGLCGAFEVTIRLRGGSVLRIQGDPGWLTLDEMADFCDQASRLAEKRRVRLGVVRSG